MFNFQTKVLTIVLLASVCYGTVNAHANDTCNMEMYGNDTAAYWACAIQFAHQSNWFPSPIAGLFSYEIWNGYDGFWQNGAVLETMVNFIANTNGTNKRYLKVIQGGDRNLYSLLEAYGPYPSFDDMGWYGLSYARMYEVLGDQQFLRDSQDIFDWSWKTGWDASGTCGGGFWFDNLFASKQTITNVQMLNLAAKLYRLTGQEDYKTKMQHIYDYMLQNQIINNETYLVADGATDNCTASNVTGPTYNSGVLIGGLVEMFKVDNKTSHLDLAYKVAMALINVSCDHNGVLVEYCEPNCNFDEIMFKGIFTRNLRYYMDAIIDPFKLEYFQKFLNTQVKSNLEKNLCDEIPISKCNISYQDGPPYYNKSGPVFSYDWRGPFKFGAPMQQTSVMDLFISAISPGTVCKGQYCDYDPYFPAPQPLTCGSHPCPTDQQCCEYNPYSSYTCCATGQKCNKKTGICE